MTITDFRDFRSFLRQYLSQQAKKGHGLLSLWAGVLGVSTTLLSQVMADKKSLSLEHAEALARHLQLSSKETDYFLLLVELDRAGTKSLKNRFEQKVTEAQNEARLLKNRVENATILSAEVQATYYSSWTFSGVRNLLSCPQSTSIDEVAAALNLPRPSVAKVLEFLLQHGLAVQTKSGFDVGPQSTYLTSDSPLVIKHHHNWRIKALQQMDTATEQDLFYTSPMSLSENLAGKLRKFLVDKIEELHAEVEPSKSEVVRCLNIDWFRY